MVGSLRFFSSIKLVRLLEWEQETAQKRLIELALLVIYRHLNKKILNSVRLQTINSMKTRNDKFRRSNKFSWKSWHLTIHYLRGKGGLKVRAKLLMSFMDDLWRTEICASNLLYSFQSIFKCTHHTEPLRLGAYIHLGFYLSILSLGKKKARRLFALELLTMIAHESFHFPSQK